MKLVYEVLDICEFGEPEEVARVAAANANSEKDMDAFTKAMKPVIDKLFAISLSDWKKKKVKVEGRPAVKHIAQAEYNGHKVGLQVVMWDNPWSTYVEYNVIIKPAKNSDSKSVEKIFDKGNSVMDKITKGQKYGRQFYKSLQLGIK